MEVWQQKPAHPCLQGKQAGFEVDKNIYKQSWKKGMMMLQQNGWEGTGGPVRFSSHQTLKKTVEAWPTIIIGELLTKQSTFMNNAKLLTRNLTKIKVLVHDWDSKTFFAFLFQI